MDRKYDVVVLGSGIAGSATALVLSKLGLSTLVVEKKTHPRFVIGESTVPTTTLLLHQLSEAHGIPELAHVSHYLGLRDQRCAAWPKQGFWYGAHREHTPLDPSHELMFETLLLPVGPDVHMLRADADAYLANSLNRYGVTHEDRTEVLDFRTSADAAHVSVSGPDGEREITAQFVVDTTGHASFFAKRLGLRDEVPALRTNTRSIFAHYKNVPPLDEVIGGCNPAFRFKRQGCTMHHCFRDGWIWVIPFDNGVTSVGFQLDRDTYPLNEAITPEQEIQALFERFPTIRSHLGKMMPVRPVIRADRIQFTSRTILGDRFILAPHAAGFIEPLFSTGILLTTAFISRFAQLASDARSSGDWSQARFQPLEQLFFQEVKQIDRLVNGMIHSFRNYDVFKQYWRNWIIGTIGQFSMTVLAKGATLQHPMLYGSGLPGFPEALEEMHQMVCQPPGDERALAEALKARVDPWFERICAPALKTTSREWSVGSKQACAVHGCTPNILEQWLAKLAVEYAPLGPHFNFSNALEWITSIGPRRAAQLERYQASQREGGDYHHAYHQIYSNENPERFKYPRS